MTAPPKTKAFTRAELIAQLKLKDRKIARLKRKLLLLEKRIPKQPSEWLEDTFL